MAEQVDSRMLNGTESQTRTLSGIERTDATCLA
jgi:hypothetical protein